jgi:aerobic carbon-monoxide dehydrogenase large subunit
MTVVGTRVVRKEDPKFLTTGGVYSADLRDERLAGAAHVGFVRSSMAHAKVTSIDVSEARKAPGVVAVLLLDDLQVAEKLMAPPIPFLPAAMSRPLLANDKVRFVGEPIAVIVAESAAQAADAAELVVVEYAPLPAVVDMESALTSSTLLFEDHGTNICLDLGAMFGPPSDNSNFADCEVVVTERVVNNRVAAAPLEVRSAAAAYVQDRLIFWMSTQAAQAVRDGITAQIGLEPGELRVIAPDVGGGFGAKIGPTPEDVIVALLAKQLKRPMRWTETRSENMMNMVQGRAQTHHITIGGKKDGTVLAYRLDVVQDAGAYALLGAFLPFLTRIMACGVYNIPKVECNARSVVTNTTPTAAYRGAGRPEATAAIERAMDLFAAEIGMDAVDVRRKNLMAPFTEPTTTTIGTAYDTGNYVKSLDLALAAADYKGLRAEQAKRRASNSVKQMGIGVAIYVEVTGGPTAGEEWGKVVVNTDGSATVYTGSSSHGQGHATSWSMITADKLGIDMHNITVIHGDTDLVPKGVGTYGSRSLQLGGAAVLKAADTVIGKARGIAAELLEANADDVVHDAVRGAFHVNGSPSVSKSWAEVAKAAADTGGLEADEDFKADSPTYPFGAHVVVTEVDTETGQVVISRVITCDDSGLIINPNVVEGQRHGGIAQGIGQALLEEVRFDDDGNPVTSNFADYGIISMAELPSFELTVLETATPMNPLGAKGIGESGAIGSTPAVQSSVVDALAHLGVRHIDIPLTAEKVWRSLSTTK